MQPFSGLAGVPVSDLNKPGEISHSGSQMPVMGSSGSCQASCRLR